MSHVNVLSYQAVRDQLKESKPHLLLGNGFSIACHSIFHYESLYDKAVKKGLSEQAQAVFTAHRTTNFEAIMRLLDEAETVARVYGLILADEESPIQKDNDFIKKILVNTIADSHLNNANMILADRLNHAVNFLARYDQIFTTNYDLLLEWVLKHSPSRHDGFEESLPSGQADTVFLRRESERTDVFYLHGALFLYAKENKVYKQTWTDSTQSVHSLVETSIASGKYPLCITEGNSEQKVRRINRNTYLSFAMQKLRGVRKPLVIFGHSLGSGDEHILTAIAENKSIPAIYVGLHGNPHSPKNHELCDAAYGIAAKREALLGNGGDEKYKLAVYFYQSETAKPWG
ncbi:MAG: DUF4917 family protein [Caldilineaceae bacterium]